MIDKTTTHSYGRGRSLATTLVLILIAGLMLSPTTTQAQQRRQVILDKVVAVVGGSSIFHSDVQAYAKELVEQRRMMGYTSDRDPMDEALEGLMQQKLLYNQALLDSVQLYGVDIPGRVESFIQARIEEEGSIQAVETKEHMPIFTYREILRQKFEEQAYAQTMQSEVVSKVTIVPGEVERFYRKIDKDSLPIIGEQYVYAQITMFPESLKEAQQRTKERLLDMRERVIKGEARFSVLARMYSLDGSAIHGGEMEPGPSNMYVRPFAEALEKLKPGQISEIVETEFGFHLIELIDKKGDNYHCRHIVIRPTFTREELMQPAYRLDSIANLIRCDSMTFEEAARQYSDDASSKMNGGIVSNHDILERQGVFDGARMTATRFLKEDFGLQSGKALEDYNALMQLKVGEISPSFQTADFKGNQMSKIVKLVEVIPAHTASLEEDYIRLEQMALMEKQQRVFDEWLAEKIKSMYVYIDPDYRSDELRRKNWVK